MWMVSITLLLAALIGYGLKERTWLEVTHHDIGSVHARPPIRIMQLSDLHLSEVDQLAPSVTAQVRARHPDVIVLTGDVVDHPESLPSLEALLDSLGDAPVIAILGNWEYWSKIDLKALPALYARHHAELLVNACVQLELKGRTLNFVGLDDATASHAKLRKAALSCPSEAEAILLEHSPAFFGEPREPSPGDVPFLLSLSGHTHGGQVTFFGSPLMLPPGSGAYDHGLYVTQYGPLYVSRGIGTSELPLRIGARPEIAEIDLK